MIDETTSGKLQQMCTFPDLFSWYIRHRRESLELNLVREMLNKYDELVMAIAEDFYDKLMIKRKR